MSIVPTWPIAAVCLAVGLAGGATATRAIYVGKIDKIQLQHTEELRQREVQRAADEAKARNIERQLVEVNSLIEQEKTNEIDRIRRDSAAAIARLQNRPDRKPASAGSLPGPAPSCEGATGAELSRPDAVFLSGEAARADEQRAALAACYQAYDSAYKPK